jgi:hypothetical protein
MSPEDFRAQLQYDLEWREREFTLLINQLGNMSEYDKKIYRKTLLVMLYSHFEGFCKFAFLTYLKLINEERIARSEANEYIIASSLLDVFHDIEHSGNTCNNIFNIDSNEKKFSKFFVRTHFIRSYNEILLQDIDISDRFSSIIVDTKSNLTLNVLVKILYRLGLPYDQFDSFESTISNLLTRRGDIAHGKKVDGIDENHFMEIEMKIFEFINSLIILLTDAARNKAFLKREN